MAARAPTASLSVGAKLLSRLEEAASPKSAYLFTAGGVKRRRSQHPPRLAYEVPGGGRTLRSMTEQDGCAALQRCVLSEAPSEVATPGSEQSMYCEEVPSW